jgi:hypothetical protein
MTRWWSESELERIGAATELELRSRRHDGTLRAPTTMWVVRVGAGIYVRSAGGPDRPWYTRAKASGIGHIAAGGVERDVTFDDATEAPHADLDEAYHAKYDHYGASVVDSVVGAGAARVTLRLSPAT